MKRISQLLLLLAAVLLYGCGSKPNSPLDLVEYIPFQSSEDGRWGLISPEGKVLFADEFTERPTVAVNGRFMVRNTDGLWEIYTTEEKPVQVGAAYLEAGLFYEDVAPAVEKGKCVVLIDRDGKEVKALDKLDGKAVRRVSNFWEGIAIFETTEGYFGAIDTKGNIVLRPAFSDITMCHDGRIIAVDKKYKDAGSGDKSKVKFAVFNRKGELISEIPLGKFENIEGTFYDDVMPAGVERDGSTVYGLLDEKGEWVLMPNSRIKRISEVHDGHFIYSDGENYGLMNFKGETVLRAKYDRLSFGPDGLLFARNDSDDDYMLINYDGEQVGKETFQRVQPFLGGSHAPVRLSDNYWGLVDKKGELIKDLKAELYDIDASSEDTWIESDYVDLGALADAMKLSSTSLAGYDFNQTAQSVISEICQRPDNGYYDKPENYTYSDELSFPEELGELKGEMHIAYPGYIARALTETYNTGYYSYPRTTGYAYNDVRPRMLGLDLEMTGKLDGKGEELFKVVSQRLAGMGATVKENDSAKLVRFSNGNYGVAALDGTKLAVIVSSVDLSNLDLNSLAGGTSASMTEAPADSMAADSTVADSAAVDY